MVQSWCNKIVIPRIRNFASKHAPHHTCILIKGTDPVFKETDKPEFFFTFKNYHPSPSTCAILKQAEKYNKDNNSPNNTMAFMIHIKESFHLIDGGMSSVLMCL